MLIKKKTRIRTPQRGETKNVQSVFKIQKCGHHTFKSETLYKWSYEMFCHFKRYKELISGLKNRERIKVWNNMGANVTAWLIVSCTEHL